MRECSRCGECCLYLPIGLELDLKPDDRLYLEHRGAIFKQGLILLRLPCKQLVYVWTATGKQVGIDDWTVGNRDMGLIQAKCLVEDNKPLLCRKFVGKTFNGGVRFYVPERCTMKEVKPSGATDPGKDRTRKQKGARKGRM